MAGGAADLRVVSAPPDVVALQRNGESVFMLLYLNEKTWVEQGAALEGDVRVAREGRIGLLGKMSRLGSGDSPASTQLKIILVHENDPSKGGCQFGTFSNHATRTDR